MPIASERHRRYLAGEYSFPDHIDAALSAIDRRADLNAVVYHDAEKARQRAASIDARRQRGEKLGRLAGLTVAVKDNICIQDEPVSCGSRILQSYRSPYSATVVEKLLAEDAVIIGKTNLDEFAMGSSTENSIFGAVRNPHDPQRVAGGSSGGSAVAVAAQLADLSLGSDTGGSIRQPASYCGVVGLKPSYGRVSRYGLVAYASSLDQVGPFGNSIADVALLLGVIAGHDPRDATSSPLPVEDYLAESVPDHRHKQCFGIPAQLSTTDLDDDVAACYRKLQELLIDAGHEVRPVDLHLDEYAIAAYYIIATAEASSNLSRYDGVRYGYRAAEPADLDDMYVRTRSDGFSMEVKRRIMLGTYALSSGYYDAYYKKAQQVRRLIQEQYLQALDGVDAILMPTAPTPAFRIGEKIDDPMQMYLSDVFTVTVNLAGVCAVSLPGCRSAAGLPIGMQLVGGAFRELPLLRTARLVEKLIENS